MAHGGDERLMPGEGKPMSGAERATGVGRLDDACIEAVRRRIGIPMRNRQRPHNEQVTEDALRHFAHAMAQAKTQKKRRLLWSELLRTLAADQVPERPGRREPRAVKRKKNRYPRLIGPRTTFRDHMKRHDRRKIARLRKLGLM